jgi:integrase/recombinase XerC
VLNNGDRGAAPWPTAHQPTADRSTSKVKLVLPEPTKKALAAWVAVRGTAAGPLFGNFDHARKGTTGRLSHSSVARIVGRLGADVGFKARPHGLRHTAITEAVRLAQEHGYGLEGAMQFSRHKSLAVLQVYVDNLEDAGGKIADLVAGRIAARA